MLHLRIRVLSHRAELAMKDIVGTMLDRAAKYKYAYI